MMTLPTPYWQSDDGRATLYCGDCLELLPLFDKVDAIITDPPFGVGNFVQVTGNIRGDQVDWNDSIPDSQVFELMRLKSRHRIIWGANFFNCFEPNGGAIVWFKDQTIPNFSKCDIASCSHLKKTEFVSVTWSGFRTTKVSDHPCERPVELYEWCVRYLPNPRTILDPFAGSGTTGVACIQTGRKFIGIELSEKYCAIAARRLAAACCEDGGLFDPKAKHRASLFSEAV